MTHDPMAPISAVSASPEALTCVASFTAGPHLPERRPAFEQVRVESDGRCVATNGHVLAVYDPATAPTEQPFPNYQRVIPEGPPLVKVRVGLDYLHHIVSSLDRLASTSLDLEIWAPDKPLKLSASDEHGTLTFYLMPLDPNAFELKDVSAPMLTPPAEDDGVPF